MHSFSELKQVPLREIWGHEAGDFTPWLAEHIQMLGDALGMDLELMDREASVGDFSLDLLAQDLGSSRTVIIENQLTQTDHDHLGKLLTYAAGFDALTAVWISEKVRDEHRQTLEWLNQKTDTELQFFAVEAVILKIGDSIPVLGFKVVAAPHEWQKSKKQKTATSISLRVDGISKETDSTSVMLAQYRNENDHVNRFLTENYERHPGEEVSESDLYEEYETWAENEGIKALSKTKFRDGVSVWLGAKRKRKSAPPRPYYWQGIAERT